MPTRNGSRGSPTCFGRTAGASLRACLSVRFQGFTPSPQYRPSASSRLWPARPADLCLPDPCGLGSNSHGGKAFSVKLLEFLTQTGSKFVGGLYGTPPECKMDATRLPRCCDSTVWTSIGRSLGASPRPLRCAYSMRSPRFSPHIVFYVAQIRNPRFDIPESGAPDCSIVGSVCCGCCDVRGFYSNGSNLH